MQASQGPKKVVVIGPECTGKSELSKFLAAHYKTVCVDEYARDYINNLSRDYGQGDLASIAHGQALMEDEQAKDAGALLICDTNAIVVKVWSDYKYGSCDPDILRQISTRHYDLYLLTYIDIPWQEDPQREHPDKREYFWKIFKDEVIKTGVPFTEINGPREQRRSKAIEAIENILQKHN